MSQSIAVLLVDSITNKSSLIATTIAICAISYIILLRLNDEKPYPGIPLVGGDFGLMRSKRMYAADAKGFAAAALKQTNEVFQMYTDTGTRIVVPPKYADEIRNAKELSFAEFVNHDFMAWFPAFGAFHSIITDDVFQETVRINLTQSLAKITVGLSEETSLSLKTLLPGSEGWQTTPPFHGVVVQMIAQLSARVFLGTDLCRDPEWLRVSISYSIDCFQAIQKLRAYPPMFRPIMYHLIPEVRRVKADQDLAYRIVEPELNRRRNLRMKEQHQSKGGSAETRREKPVDSLQWLDEVATARSQDFNVVFGQLAFAIAAIHTTSQAMTNILFDLIARPNLIEQLRKEIIATLGPEAEGGGGWKKTTLHKLRLMDSVMKESQRVTPLTLFSMNRVATSEYKLSNGTVIPAHAPISMPSSAISNHGQFSDPETYDGYRFLKMREMQGQGNENKWQFVTTSPEMFGFGHGRHACPGRFFASNEMKIALVHMLMKYDWMFEGEKQGIEGRPATFMHVDQFIPDPTVKLQYRERKPEIEL